MKCQFCRGLNWFREGGRRAKAEGGMNQRPQINTDKPGLFQRKGAKDFTADYADGRFSIQPSAFIISVKVCRPGTPRFLEQGMLLKASGSLSCRLFHGVEWTSRDEAWRQFLRYLRFIVIGRRGRRCECPHRPFSKKPPLATDHSPNRYLCKSLVAALYERREGA